MVVAVLFETSALHLTQDVPKMKTYIWAPDNNGFDFQDMTPTDQQSSRFLEYQHQYRLFVVGLPRLLDDTLWINALPQKVKKCRQALIGGG